MATEAKIDFVFIDGADRPWRVLETEHLPAILRHQISVVWVRGLERQRNTISIKDLHLMLTVKLPDIEARLRETRRPTFFLLYLASGNRPTLRPIRTEELRRAGGRSIQ